MAENSKIEWTDSTFNPWIGCTKVGPGCDHCYAEADFDLRKHRAKWGPGNPRSRTSPANWKKPQQWNAKPFFECDCGWRGDDLEEHNKACNYPSIGRVTAARRRVFCASLADVFDNQVPPLWRQHLMSLVADTPHLDWLFLTKRIGNARRMLSDASMHDGRLLTADDQYRPPDNLWIGATVVDQTEADRDIPKLMATPAAKRFLSIEPMLGPISLRWLCAWPENAPTVAQRPGGTTNHLDGLRRLDWVICGGESGPGARPVSPDWARQLRDQCEAAGVPFLFKQWGEWVPMLGQVEGVSVRDKTTTPDGWVVGRAGKRAAGRTLDGRLHDGFPNDQHEGPEASAACRRSALTAGFGGIFKEQTWNTRTSISCGG